MKLDRKKKLAARVLGVGTGRIRFDSSRIEEIKEAITKQDMRDLFRDKAITIREITGRKGIVRRKNRRGAGKVKKKINSRKADYVRLTRKLRKHASELLGQKRISREDYINIRKKIKAKLFKSKVHMGEHLK